MKPETDFSKPTLLDRVTVVFGAAGTVFDLMPRWNDIPDDFRKGYTPWNKTASEWFYRGMKGWPYNPKPGIDHKAAQSHLGAILRSFESKHEHKMAATAYLMNLWYEPSRAVPHKATMKPRTKPKPTNISALDLKPTDRVSLAGGVGDAPAGERKGLFG